MPFDRIVYFGDSLTDSDEFFNLASALTVFPLPSALFGYAGQFSNGDVYADIAPTILGIGADESVNYAVGGARAVGNNPLGLFLANSPLAVPNPDPDLVAFDSNLTAQVDRFLEDAPGLGDLSGSAVSIFIGLNDLNGLANSVDPANFDFAAFAVEAQQLAADIVASTFSAAQRAVEAGVGTVILHTLPSSDFFPLGQGIPPQIAVFGNQLVDGINAALVQGAAGLEQLGVNAIVVDFAALSEEIQANGSGYGFLNTTNSLFIGTGADPQFVDPDGDGPLPALPVFDTNPAVADLDADQFAFYDLLHPTTALHGILGAFQAATIEGDNIEFLGDGNNFSRGTIGNELIFAQGGNDRAIGGAGADVIFGGDGRDYLRGGSQNDILGGGDGNDFLLGDFGSDVLAGNDGNDFLSGGGGADAIIDGLGSDRGFGGVGDDLFFYAEADLIGGTTGTDRDSYRGGTGEDTLFLVVEEENRASVEAEIARGGSAINFKNFTSIGLITTGIENFVLLDSRAEFDEIIVGDIHAAPIEDLADVDGGPVFANDEIVPLGLQAVLDEAEFWNLI
ncbi:MAG: SGNH/GDSL hydrolase family protein [Pseudomonadota bacterium]